MIAITDHWCGDSAKSLIDEATNRGIVALPGFEANSEEGVHLLVLFEAGTDPADINAAIGACGVTPGCSNGSTGHPFKQVMHVMHERGALVVPAHVNVANGGMLTTRSGPPLANMVTNPRLHAIAVTPGVDEAPDQEAACRGRKPFERDHPLSVIYADDVTSPEAVAKLGATTWFKVSSLSLASIKLAVRTPVTRVRVEDPAQTARPLIRGISWVGGFLDGVSIPVSSDLTTLIGGRGTGKSTVVESLRYALKIEPIGADAKRDHDNIVAGVLRQGTTVRVEVETPTPVPQAYTIERSVPNPPIVRDSSGTITSLQPLDVLGPVEVFGQHELAELAQDKLSVARMLERFAGSTGADPVHEQLLEKLGDNRAKLTRAEEKLEKLDEELADIPRLQEHVDSYAATDLPTRLEELKRLDSDESVFTEGTDRIKAVRVELAPLLQSLTVAALASPISGIDDSPQSAILQRVSTATGTLADSIAQLLASLTTSLDTADREVGDAKAAWTASTAEQRDGHADVLRKLVDEGHDPAKYLTTTKALETLRAKEQRRPDMVSTIAALNKDRGELLGELQANEAQQAKSLNNAIRQANSATGGRVVVQPIPAPDRSHIKKVIEDGVRGSRTQIMAAVDSNAFSPREFVAVARRGAPDLEATYGIRGAQANNTVTAGEGLFRKLEELTVGQAVDVRLDVGTNAKSRDLRSLDDLSKGQRATALLLLLLGASTAPLIIDQPEDDLDNRFVYDGIVQRLRELKGTRQVIASTHNANVPVLGDAELVVALESDGQHGQPMANGVGSLDDAPIRELIENLLEGGHTAFNARRHLYGF